MRTLKFLVFRTLSSLALTGAVALASPHAAAQLADVIDAQKNADRAAAESQRRINEINERTQDAASQYAQALADADSFEKYNERLALQVRSQEEEIASIERQLQEIETTSREIQPLMQNMVQALEQFVMLDVPFMLEERLRRVANLEEIMGRADVSIAEKYRRILEAYQIELEYGRTLEAYEGWLGEGDDARAVEFVRLGRVSLLYRTQDGSETGYWDAHRKDWVVDASYADEVQEALRVARKAGAPALLTLPVPAPGST